MLPTRTGSARALPPLSLDDPALYQTQIERLSARRERDRWLVPVDQISGALDGHGPDIAQRLARDVPREGYSFTPLIPHPAVLQGKPRIIYRVDALDAVVWGAYCRALSRAIEPRLGDHLYSYRTGRSQFMAAADCVTFFQAHVRKVRDPRSRGIFVLRRDVRRYDETIAVDDASSLWTTLRELAKGTPLVEGPVALQLMNAAFRPPIIQPDGSVSVLARGMPTGIPSQTIACNVYLTPVDSEMVAVEGGFYARFGDDILFAHPDLGAVRHASAILDAGIARLGLELNTRKSLDYFLTGVGRAHPDAPDFTPVRKLPYLGLDVGFDGTRLRADKRRELLRELYARIDRTHAEIADCPLPERARALASVVRDAMSLDHVLRHRYAGWLQTRSMSRADLAQLDHFIALRCAERLTGKRGIRSLRDMPRKTLHDDYGLPSVLHAWDLARRAGRGMP